MTELLLLAVTKMQSGVCIGGMPLEPDGGLGTEGRVEGSRLPAPGSRLRSPRWIRPIKPFGTLLLGDIRYGNGTLMRPWDVITIQLGRARTHPPHVEDVEADFVHQRPELQGRLDEGERRDVLERIADPDPDPILRGKERSLTLFRPASVTATFSFDPYSGHYEARFGWPGCGRADGLPVTDLKWRALGRRLTAEGPAQQRLDEPELRRLLGCEDLWVAAGLSRAFHGEHWPLVVAVHTLPDYEATIDETRL